MRASFVAVLFLTTVSVAVAQARPNVLLIVSEDNGPEIGCYGDPFARTPNLDALASSGVRFRSAFVPYSVCSPSRAAYLTGLHPLQNGQVGLATHRFAMDSQWDSIPAALKRRGYRTGLIGKLHVNPASAFPFDSWRIKSANFGRRKMEEYAEAAAAFFAEADGEPFFLSVNFPDAHLPLHRQQFGVPAEPLTGADVRTLPWVGADSPRLREFTADYYNCLERLDTGVGLLLDELEAAGKSEDTLVIYMGDHGAQFSRGKCSVYEAALRVPLLVRWPGRVKPGHVVEDLVSSLDLLPTVLRAVDAPIPPRLTGRPLQPLLRGESPAWRSHVFGFTTGSAPRLFYPQYSVRDERYKLIWNPLPGRENRFARTYLERGGAHFATGTMLEEIAASSKLVQEAYARFLSPPEYELYDLRADPHEWRDLAGDPDHAKARETLVAELLQWRKRIDDPFLEPAIWQRFVAGQDARVDNGHRKKGFRWGYLDDFARWRSRTSKPEIVTVFNAGDHGYPHHRIPSLVRTNRGTLIAIAEGRQGGDHSHNDIVCRRSVDGGRSWGPLQVIAERGDDVLIDTQSVVDRRTGRILCAVNFFRNGYHNRAAEPGYESERANRHFLVTSDDDGRTWSGLQEITEVVKPVDVTHTIIAPGKGIQLTRGEHAGRLLISCYRNVPHPKKNLHRRPHVIWSDDGGASWHRGELAEIDADANPGGDASEPQLVELADGSILMSCRTPVGRNLRRVAHSRDGGATWSALRYDTALRDPRCQGSVVRLSPPDAASGAAGVIAFLNPDSQRGRENGTLRLSFDDGRTWSHSRTVWPGSFGYSAMAVLENGGLGMLFETDGANTLRFARVPPAWIAAPRLSVDFPFGDHMVLPRDRTVAVRGRADPGLEVKVSFADRTATGRADDEGRFALEIGPCAASAEPRQLVVSTQRTSLRIDDVVVGDVWLCTGQSNMDFPVARSAEADAVLARASLPQLRLLHQAERATGARRRYGSDLLEGLEPHNLYPPSAWRRSSASAAADFSAVGHSFGVMLQRELDVPIGLIANAFGGAPIESFLDPVAIVRDKALAKITEDWIDCADYPAWCRQRARFNLGAWFDAPRGHLPNHPFEPAFLWYAAIEPLLEFPIRGVAWYQGESNATGDGALGVATDPVSERHKLELLIGSFRRAWGRGDLPFLMVQLPGLNRDWPQFREMQLDVAGADPHTALAIAIDLGHPTDVHPRRKVPVGERLARLALAGTHGRDLVASGPLYRTHIVDGSTVGLVFDHVGEGLSTLDGDPLRGFEIAGDDRRFHPAQARIDRGTVVVTSAAVSRPVAVRYAWAPYPDANLCNSEKLPASPFRTHRW